MKKIIFLLIAAVSIVSCSVGESGGSQFLIGPVQDVSMPANYKVDSTSTILIRYKRASDCHIFNGIYYSIEGNTRIVAIKFVRVDGNNCQPDSDSVYELPLNFKPTTAGTYTFRFFTGRAADGSELYTDQQAIVGQ